MAEKGDVYPKTSGHTQHKVETAPERDLGTSASIPTAAHRMPPLSEFTHRTTMQPDVFHLTNFIKQEKNPREELPCVKLLPGRDKPHTPELQRSA